MTAAFITRNTAAKTLTDSRYISMGLVKSGYMQPMGSRSRMRLSGMNSNPGNLDHYNVISASDSIHGFTVNAICPVVFVAGRALFMDVVRSGMTLTYSYAHASTACRYYVFDLMSDRGPGAKLKLRDRNGNITLDSTQLPLSIAAAVSPPLPPAVDGPFQGLGDRAYVGGAAVEKYSTGVSGGFTVISEWRHRTGLVDCAVTNSWSRGMAHTSNDPWAESYSGREAAYGQGGDLVFIMGTDAGAIINPYFNQFNRPGWWIGSNRPTLFGIPVTRLPTATAIEANGLPIPFDITT